MKYKIISSLLIIILFFRLGAHLLNITESIFARDYHGKYEHLYSNYYSSQYVRKVNPNIIPDNALEAFAGGIFLKGLNPILIVHDQPPLGRYIISLSILLFDNAGTIPILLYLVSLLGLFLISRRIFKNFVISLLPIGLFVNEPLYLNGFLIFPTLEQIQFPFIIFTIYFFIKSNREKKYIIWFVLTSIMLGFVVSIRFFSLGATLLISMVTFLYIHERNNKKFFRFLITLPLSLVILFLSYTKTILSGYSLLQIIGIQKYMLLYHKSKFILPFTFWDLLLFNRWHTWWGSRAISFDVQWIPFWPVSSIMTLCLLFANVFKKIKTTTGEQIIISWVLWYMIFLSFGYSSVRYFLPLIPFLYILAFSFVVKLLKIRFPKSKSL